MVRFTLTCVVLLVALTMLGCSDSGLDTVSVSGTVYLDDNPVEGLEVCFYSGFDDFLSSGVTDAAGHYELELGAVPGDNKVWISKQTLSEADPAGDMEDPGEMEAIAGVADVGTADTEGDQLPAKYSSPDETELKCTVPVNGTESADFKLASE